jgi:hypothetical protein
MEKGFVKSRMIDIFVFGILLWLMGFIGSLILFPFVSSDMLGWILCIIFTPITLIIAYFRFRNRNLKLYCYFMTGVFWVLIAATLDYFFIVKLFNATNYYKLDVYIYYIITFLVPIVIGLLYGNKKNKRK